MKIFEQMKYELLMMNIDRIPTQIFDNLGQHAIAGYLETKGFCAKVYSGVSMDYKNIIEKAVTEDKVPVLGFYVATDNKPVVSHVIRWVKKNFNVYVFVGGSESVALKEDFLAEPSCDAVIEGDGEIPVFQLLSSLVDGLIPLNEVSRVCVGLIKTVYTGKTLLQSLSVILTKYRFQVKKERSMVNTEISFLLVF